VLRSSLNGDSLPTELNQMSHSELLYDWRFTTNQFILMPSSLRLTTIWHPRRDFIYCQIIACLLMWGALSDERTGLSTTGQVCHLQPLLVLASRRSHSRVWVPRDSWPHFTISDSRLLQPGGLGPRIYIPQEQCSPAILPGTGFPHHHLWTDCVENVGTLWTCYTDSFTF
jgi:hypothetical protein